MYIKKWIQRNLNINFFTKLWWSSSKISFASYTMAFINYYKIHKLRVHFFIENDFLIKTNLKYNKFTEFFKNIGGRTLILNKVYQPMD